MGLVRELRRHFESAPEMVSGRIDMICPLLSGPKSMLFWIMKEIIGKLSEAEVVLAPGAMTAEACRRMRSANRPNYRWRKEYGGRKTDEARRMNNLEKENARLWRAIPDLTLDKLILQEAVRGNF